MNQFKNVAIIDLGDYEYLKSYQDKYESILEKNKELEGKIEELEREKETITGKQVNDYLAEQLKEFYKPGSEVKQNEGIVSGTYNLREGSSEIVYNGGKSIASKLVLDEDNPLYKQHLEKLLYLKDLYIQKNKAYGNSFDQSLDEFGIVGSHFRMTDKWNRFKQFAKDPNTVPGDESLEDTLIDLANYAIMTVMWLEREEESKK